MNDNDDGCHNLSQKFFFFVMNFHSNYTYTRVQNKQTNKQKSFVDLLI